MVIAASKKLKILKQIWRHKKQKNQSIKMTQRTLYLWDSLMLLVPESAAFNLSFFFKKKEKKIRKVTYGYMDITSI